MGLSVLCILNFCDGEAGSFLLSAQVGLPMVLTSCIKIKTCAVLPVHRGSRGPLGVSGMLGILCLNSLIEGRNGPGPNQSCVIYVLACFSGRRSAVEICSLFSNIKNKNCFVSPPRFYLIDIQ